MAGTTAQVDVALLLVLLGLAALVSLGLHLGRTLAPRHGRPTLPAEDCPPPGLGRLLPVGRQVDAECRRGFEALERWMRTQRVRP